MPDSYFVTYGNDRVCLAGTPGAVAWEAPSAMVILDPGRTSNDDYLKMRFVTPEGGEIILEDGSGNNLVSASAMVPVNSTAYWTANGVHRDDKKRSYHVTALSNMGFAGVSAYTSVTTAFYTSPSVESYGSAKLIATGSASASGSTVVSHKATYGEGGTSWYTRVSASSWAGNYSGPWGTAAGNVMWIPDGAKVVYSASSVAGKTYTVQPTCTGLSGYEIVYAHGSPGTHSTVSGYMNTAYDFRLGSGRSKAVYATGTAYTLGVAASASAAAWQPVPIITAFSSNLSTGSSISTFLNGSANANKVNGFAASTKLGRMKNSAGTWSNVTGTNSLYNWADCATWVSNSAYASGSFSAMRHKGATGNNNSTWCIFGRTTANASYAVKSGTFAVPTASGKTSTTTQTATASLTGDSANAFIRFSNTVAQSTALRANCRGAWTASGIVQ